MNVVKIDLVSKQACLGRREPVCPGLTAAKLRIFHESRNIIPLSYLNLENKGRVYGVFFVTLQPIFAPMGSFPACL